MTRENIRYPLDKKGRKQSMLLPISQYGELSEDLFDLADTVDRKRRPAEALDVLQLRLQEKHQNTE